VPDPNERIRISVLVRPRRSLEELASRKEMGSSLARERQYLTREEFAARYGADPADVAKVEAFAHQHNLTVVEASLARRTIVLSGTIAALSAAFEVRLANYEHPEGTFRGRTGPVMIPSELAGVVQGVFGFDNRRQARPRFRQAQTRGGTFRAAALGGYTPTQIAQLYNFPSGVDGTGECIGILEFGGGYQSSDLDSYFQQLGVATPSITAVSVDDVQNQPQPGPDSPDVEVDLDIEMAGGAAPGAQIVVYFAPFTEQGWVDAITTVVNDSLHKPSVLSISWGFAEGQNIWTSQAIQTVEQSFLWRLRRWASPCAWPRAMTDRGMRSMMAWLMSTTRAPAPRCSPAEALPFSPPAVKSPVKWFGTKVPRVVRRGAASAISLP